MNISVGEAVTIFRKPAPSQCPLKSISVHLLTFADFETGGFCLA